MKNQQYHYLCLIEELRKRLQNGQLHAGDVLPSEQEWAEALSIKKRDVRPILKNLEMTYNQANLLSIIFFENFLYSNKSFGQYLEQLITNYFSNCEELQFDVLKMLTTDREKWDMQMTQSYFSWFGYKNFPDDTWDWINNLSNRATQCLTTICDFNNGVELLDEKKSKNQ